MILEHLNLLKYMYIYMHMNMYIQTYSIEFVTTMHSSCTDVVGLFPDVVGLFPADYYIYHMNSALQYENSSETHD